MSRIEIIGDCTLYLGDCREILPTLGKVDAVVTDPPYGIGASRMTFGKWRTSRMEKSGWDDAAPELDFLEAMNAPTIVWGGNYFGLRPSRAFLVWNKGAGFRGRDFAECEYAWCSFDANARVFDYDPLARGAYRDKEHPTQKPIPLMAWCLQQIPAAKLICDPFMGSGSTGVACALNDRHFIGVEVHEPYFDIACKRITEAYKQPRLFAEPEAKPVQSKLFGDAA